jgi:hypothetical protein
MAGLDSLAKLSVNMGAGWEEGGVESDEDGMQIMGKLEDNMAWLLQKLR